MTGSAGSPPGRAWEVRLTRKAAESLRSLPPVVRREVTRALDGLAVAGAPPSAGRGGDADVRVVSTTTHRIRVLPRTDAGVLLVVGVERTSATARLPGAASRVRETLFDLGTDVRVAARSLRRSPAFALAVVLTLTVGLGGATTVYGLMHTVFRSALPFQDGDRLLRLRDFARSAAGEERAYNMSPRDFLVIREGNRVFEGVVGQLGRSLALVGEGGAMRASAVGVSEGWAEILGVRPYLGRVFTGEDEALGQDAGVALISHALWQQRFGGDPAAVGRGLRHAGGELTIVGVMGPRFTYPYDADVWMPWRFDAADWQGHDLNVVARMLAGVTEEAAREDMARVYSGIREAAPGLAPDAGVEVRTSRADFIREEGASLKGLGAAVLFLVLLACANIANLIGVRLVARRRETALRAALGAGRLRLFRLAVTEAVLLFAAGGVGGLALTALLGNAASVLIPDVLRTQLDMGAVRVDAPLVTFALVLALTAGLLTGGTAAYRASRVDLQGVLREGGRGGGGRAGGRLHSGLVVAELALSLVLLVGAGVLFDHFRHLSGADLGFRTEGLSTVSFAVDHERYGAADARDGLVTALQERIGALPAVEAVGLTSVNPLCCGDWGASLRIEGQERPADGPPIIVHHRYVTPEYFDALGLAPVRGRHFTDADRAGSPLVVVVDEAFARRFWPGEDPIGKRVGGRRADTPWREVVGVVPDTYQEGDYSEVWYLPFHQEPLGRSNEILHLMIRAGTPDVLASVRRVVAEVDPDLPLFGVSTMADLRSELLAQDRVGAAMASLFALVGLALACLGLYGLLAYQVSLGTREIGTRLALGAPRRAVVTSVLVRTAKLVAAGSVLGIAVAYVLNDVLRRLVDGVRFADPGLLALLAALLATAALASAAAPAVRAARLDPARILQAE